MNEVSLIKSSYSLIRKDFGLEDDLGFEEAQFSIDWLKGAVTERVRYLLDHDFNRLLNALYRIDIPEEEVKKALQLPKYEVLLSVLVDLIIERQKQKAITRLKYRQG